MYSWEWVGFDKYAITAESNSLIYIALYLYETGQKLSKLAPDVNTSLLARKL